MASLASLRITVHGQVQGVFFRDFVRRRAASLGLAGYVRNLSDGRSVEVVAEGESEKLEKLLVHLGIGPPHAHVDRVETSRGKYTGTYAGFRIRH